MNKDEQWLLKEKYGGVESEAFHADCERLAAGEPLGYLIGHVPFLDCTIHLDSRPLIPRPETEFWVEQAIAQMKSAGPLAPRVLDLCAGSGCIGVAVAKSIPGAHVTFAEIDPAHLPTIRKNLEKNTIIYDSKKYQIIESDIYMNVSGQFDFILSNPPYIDPALDRAEPSVKAHEPHLALYGGPAGLELIERIVAGARAALAPSTGTLYLEHEPEQVAAIAALSTTHGLTCQTHNDQYDVPRYSILSVSQ